MFSDSLAPHNALYKIVYRLFEKISSFRDLDFKQGVEKRPSRFSLIGDAKKPCAGNFALRARCKWRTARIFSLLPCCPKGAVYLK